MAQRNRSWMEDVEKLSGHVQLQILRQFGCSTGRALAVVAPIIDLGTRLAGDEWSAAEGAHCVAGSGAFDAVPLPGLPPQHEDGDAGQEAAEEAAQEAGLAQVVSIPLDEEAWDTRTAQAWKRCKRNQILLSFHQGSHPPTKELLTDFAVAEATTDPTFPFPRHVWFGVGGLHNLRPKIKIGSLYKIGGRLSFGLLLLYLGFNGHNAKFTVTNVGL